MKPRILITRPLYPDIVERLQDYFDVEVNEGARYTPSELKKALQNKEGVLIAGGDRVDADLLGGLTNLRAVCVSAAGYNTIDVDALTRAGIIATNAPGPADETVADFAWGSLIATARRLVEAERWVQHGHWKGSAGSRFFGTEVHGKRLGIIGMGRIGQAIARRAIGFNMTTYYHNRRRLTEAIEKECRATFRSKEHLLLDADFVILCLPYSPGNHHIIGEQELRLMQPRSILVNIARGGLVDEAALAGALSENRIGGAALDVFEGEPAIHPGLLDLPNAILTPHIAGATWDTQHGLASLAADNLIAALGLGPMAGKPPSILNPEVLS
ncbi:MAG: D-glycerate dehydrogenase [Bacteroidota bacterium]|nr:D-glycerate dehydrogenase [Bacteroidota bacterium]